MKRSLERTIWLTLQAMSCALVLGASAAQADPAHSTAEAEPRQQVTLERLIQDALLKSPGLQAKKRAYESARAKVFSAWLPEDPEFGVDVEGQSDWFKFSSRTDNEYMVSQTIPFPTSLILRGQVALRESQMAYQRYKEVERDVVWHIEQPYYELYLTKKTLTALEEIRSLLEKLARTVETRYEANQSSQQDLLKAQIELSKIEIEMFDRQQQEHLSEAHFSHLLNQSLDTRYDVEEEPDSVPLTLSTAELERLALKTRPELRAFEIGIKRAKAAGLLAATTWLPDITGRIEARQFKGEGGLREKDTFIGVRVPVWSLIKGIGGEWKSARRDVQEAEAAYTEMKNEVLLSVHEAYAKVRSADNALSAYEQRILPQARQQVEVALASYEAGRTDFLNLIDAQRMLKDAQMAYYQVRADHELGLSNLRLAVGGDLSKGGTP